MFTYCAKFKSYSFILMYIVVLACKVTNEFIFMSTVVLSYHLTKENICCRCLNDKIAVNIYLVKTVF